jgi:hypothetical protein
MDRPDEFGLFRRKFALDDDSVHDREDNGPTIVVALDRLAVLE